MHAPCSLRHAHSALADGAIRPFQQQTLSREHCNASAMLLICQNAALQELVLTLQHKADIASFWPLSTRRQRGAKHAARHVVDPS